MSRSFDRVASLVFMSVGLLFFLQSYTIASSSYGSNVGPDIFPKLLGIILILLSIRLFYETSKYKEQQKSGAKLDYKSFLIMLGNALFYAFFLETLGYVITTFIFLLVGFQVMEKGGLLKSLIISAGFSIGVYYLFVEVLQGSLPGLPF
jgi:putative tricarboxylic transport membrane protein